jgi:hypothetical protein
MIKSLLLFVVLSGAALVLCTAENTGECPVARDRLR